MTIGHFVVGMPYVYATPMMILHMEMAAGEAIASALPSGFVSVGTEINVRHLAATPIGGTVRAIAQVTEIGAKSVFFRV
jgi:predicted thioesterase